MESHDVQDTLICLLDAVDDYVRAQEELGRSVKAGFFALAQARYARPTVQVDTISNHQDDGMCSASEFPEMKQLRSLYALVTSAHICTALSVLTESNS